MVMIILNVNRFFIFRSLGRDKRKILAVSSIISDLYRSNSLKAERSPKKRSSKCFMVKAGMYFLLYFSEGDVGSSAHGYVPFLLLLRER